MEESGLKGEQPWDLLFNYLGQLDNVVGKGKWLQAAEGVTGMNASLRNEVGQRLQLNAYVQGGELVMVWGYSGRHYEEDTIRGLSE